MRTAEVTVCRIPKDCLTALDSYRMPGNLGCRRQRPQCDCPGYRMYCSWWSASTSAPSSLTKTMSPGESTRGPWVSRSRSTGVRRYCKLVPPRWGLCQPLYMNHAGEDVEESLEASKLVKLSWFGQRACFSSTQILCISVEIKHQCSSKHKCGGIKEGTPSCQRATQYQRTVEVTTCIISKDCSIALNSYHAPRASDTGNGSSPPRQGPVTA